MLLNLRLITERAAKLPPAKLVCGSSPLTLCFTSFFFCSLAQEINALLFRICWGDLAPTLTLWNSLQSLAVRFYLLPLDIGKKKKKHFFNAHWSSLRIHLRSFLKLRTDKCTLDCSKTVKLAGWPDRLCVKVYVENFSRSNQEDSFSVAELFISKAICFSLPPSYLHNKYCLRHLLLQ